MKTHVSFDRLHKGFASIGINVEYVKSNLYVEITLIKFAVYMALEKKSTNA